MTIRISQMGVSPPRLDLPQPIAATLADLEATILEVSLVGCAVRHEARAKVGSMVTLDFMWKNRRARLEARVMRSTMEFTEGRAVYVSGLQLAESIDKSPAVIRDIISTLVEPPAGQRAAAAAPPPPQPPPARQPEPPPARPPEPEPAAAAQPPATPVREQRAPAAPPPPPVIYDSVPFLRFDEPEEEVAPPLIEAAPKPLLFLQCRLADGRWRKERVSSPKQPEGEGFTILAPADESEADELCRTYEVADPETRRAIRFSFELSIEQQLRV